MLPTIGDIVIYHFTHVEWIDFDKSKEEIRSRPAVVVDIPIESMAKNGACSLHVFYAYSDVNKHDRDPGFTTLMSEVPAHCEAMGEVGQIESATPKPHTWSWRRPRRAC